MAQQPPTGISLECLKEQATKDLLTLSKTSFLLVSAVINPRRACARVTVVVLCVCVCLSVTTLAATCTYLDRLYVEIKVLLSFLCHFLHMHCVDFIENTLSEVLATFADHLCLVRFLKDF